MKKLFFSLLFAGSALVASAQTSGPVKTTFGIKAGPNFSSVSISQDGAPGTYNTQTLVNFSAGAFADIGITEGFSIQPGIYYSGKGFKLTQAETGTSLGNMQYTSSFNAKASIAYVEVPVNFLFNAHTSSGTFFVGGGPFAAVAVSAKQKGSATTRIVSGLNTITETENFDDKIEIGSDGGIKRTDFGATGLVGFRLNNGLSISANYDLGLVNTSGADSSEGKMKTRSYGVSLGFSF